jgi:DNA-binding MarR family transcriptional regulator
LPYANHIDGVDVPDTAELAAQIKLLVGRLARRLRQEGTAGLTPSQLSVLASVDRLGPLQLGDLARVETVAPPTLSRSIARLEERGLVRRQQDPDDGRAVLVEVTGAGRRALHELRRARVAFLAERLATLSDPDRAVVARAVELLGEILGPPGPSPRDGALVGRRHGRK